MISWPWLLRVALPAVDAEVGEMCRLLRQDTSFLRGHLPERMDIGEVADSAACRHYGRYSGSSTMVMRYQEEVTVLYCVTPVCILKKKHMARHG